MRVRYRMNITQAEFERLLPAAVAHVPIERVDGGYAGAAGAGRWRITLGPQVEERIGLVRLPLREVEIAVDGVTEEAAAAFRRRFDLYFQKGGG
ncbi:MAG: hypothetical protein JNM90_25490 [Burkholderiales bacterium]|nr:hypothetical protein [Burkholderiales bacterium]